MDKILRTLLVLMILTSFITHTIDIDSTNFVIARMTFSDIFGLLAIGLFGFKVIKKKDILREIPKGYAFGLLLIGCFLLTGITSLSPKSTIAEVLIVSYLFLVSITVFYTFRGVRLEQFFLVLVLTTFILSVIGLYDVIAVNAEFPTVFSSAQKKHGVSGFRYFGQAANYTFTMLTLLIPLKYSNLSVDFSASKKVFLNVTIVLGILFMISTGRVSIIISFAIGIFIFLLVTRERKVLKHAIYSALSLLSFMLLIYKWSPSLFNNIVHRIQSRITQRDINTPEASFIIENFKDSLQAFNDNIWMGTGLGGFVNNYSEYEIHGTYLKVLGETGLVGLVGYGLFIGYFSQLIFKNIKAKSSSFFNYFFPFFLASIVAWSYNYHLRKKEFWLLFAILMILDCYNRRNEKIKPYD